MATLRQCHEEHLNKGPLPPLRELFLEVQVSKLISDYLFPSLTEEFSPSVHYDENGSSVLKENNALSAPSAFSHAGHTLTLSACNAPSIKSVRPFHEHHRQSSCETHHGAEAHIRVSSGLHIQQSHILHSEERSGYLKSTIVKEQQSSKGPNADCDISWVTLSIQNEGGKTASLKRVDTFPYTSKSELQMGVADMEMKVSSKKPPRPPKLPNLNSNKLGPSLTRCFSDAGTFSQSSRRKKLEKKRKSALSSVSPSLWALLFTLCFAVIMIGQGFWSQASQDLATYSSNALSPFEGFAKTSKLVAQEDADAGSKSFLSNGERVKTEVQVENLSDMKKQLDVGT